MERGNPSIPHTIDSQKDSNNINIIIIIIIIMKKRICTAPDFLHRAHGSHFLDGV